ncbi:transposase, partial [Lactiplantibacillus pentosus]|nr:transposase [Lactiplantibacillus pentosus]
MGTTIKSFKKYRKQALNAVESPYSNGYLEGNIGRIKKIKNTAFGFRNWENFVNRIKIQRQWLHPARQTVTVTNCQIKRNFVPKKTSNGLFQPKTLR